jgi:ParB-like chromosome segregation protein Spo0J
MNTKDLIREVDLHRLDLRYSHTRIKNTKAQLRMQNSINMYGQIIPVLTVVERDRFVLVDGYLRFAALKACGHDCIQVQLVEKEADSLVTLLTKGDDRQMEAVEQAFLIQELHNRFSYSFSEIARRLGKDKGWVKRRLDLVESLPEAVLGAVMYGTVSSWAASRVLVPLSRANEHDCLDLTKKIIADPLSTRELVCLYDHYKKSNKTVRARIIADPQLFTKTVKEQEQQKNGQQINDGPEGKWFKDIGIACHILKRLKATSDIMLDNQCRRRCRLWLNNAEKIIIELKEQAKRKSHDNPGM